ncbi:PAS domain S-box protein [Baaleninema sp.]|uniref:PAS domain S-box protein n=1 Tax=Baaleninema sp. TaxID=3101197 RepID=UPI003CFF969F
MGLDAALLKRLVATVSQLQQDVQNYRRWEEHLPVAHLKLNRLGIVLSANRAAATLLGALPDSLVGKSVFQWLPARDRPSFRVFLESVGAGEPPQTHRCCLHRQDGRPIGAIARLSALATAEGEDHLLLVWETAPETPTPSPQERYELALTTSQVAIWDWNLVTGQLYVSPNFQHLWKDNGGTELESWETWLDGLHPDDRETVRPFVRGCLEGAAETCQFEYRVLSPKGEPRWFLSRSRIWRDERGRPQRVIGSHTDITDRKRTEAALQESETRFHHLAANVPGMIFRYLLHADGSDEIAYASPGCQTLFEISPEAACRDTSFLLEMMHPDDRDRAAKSIQLSAETLQPWSLEWRVTTPSGRQKWLQGISRPEPQPDGSIVWDGVIFDITDRKQAEDDLQTLAQRLLTVVETVGEGITLSDERGNLGIFNPKMEEITGYSNVEANADPNFLRTLYPDAEDYGQALERLEWVRQQGSLHNIETTIRAKDGSQKTLLVSTRFLALPSSESFASPSRSCYLSAYRDITERSRALAQLRQNQAFIEAIANTTPQIIYIVDLSTLRVVYVNSQISEILGYDPDVVRQRGEGFFADTWYPEDTPRLAEYVRTWSEIEDDEGREIEYRMRHADGRIRWLRSRDVTFKRNAEGKTVQVLGTATDITDRKQTEQQLRDRESQLDTVVNSTSDGIVIVDGKGIVCFANAAAARLFDRPLEELLGQEFGQPIAQGDPVEMELLRPGGRTLPVEIAVAETRWLGRPAYAVSLRDISRRRQVEEALLESELRFHQLTHNIDSVFWIVDPNVETVLYVSPAYETLWGRPRAELYQNPRHWFDVIDAEDRDRLEASLFWDASLNKPLTVEYRILRPDGVRWIRDRSFPVRDSDGTVTCIAGIAEDITDAKRAQASLRASEVALRASQERLNNVLGSIDDLVWSLCARTLQLLYVSPALVKIYGRDPTEFIEQPHRWEKVVYPGDRYPFKQAWRQLFALGQFDLEYRILRPDGTLRWVRGRARLVRDERGDPLRIDGITSDITDLKHTELAFKASEERFRSLVANLTGAIYRCLPDKFWTTVFISDAIEDITGYTPGQFLYNSCFWAQIIHPDDLDRISHSINTTIAQQEPYSFEYRIRCADGSICWVYEKGRGLWDEWGNLVYLDGTIFDITSRKEAEERLQQQAQRDRLLNTLTQRIRQSLNLQEILDNTVREVRHCLGVERVLIFQLFPNRLGRVVSESVAEGYQASVGMEFPDEEFPSNCYERYCQGLPRIVLNVETDPFAPCLVEFMKQMGVRSKVVVPILKPFEDRSPLWGLLIAHQCRRVRPWNDGEVEMLGQLAAQVSLAIQQADLYAQVQASEARLRTMFEQAAVGIAIGDLNGRLYEANHKFCEIIGYNLDELVGMSFDRFTHPEDVAREYEFMEMLISGQTRDYSMEKRYFRKDGSIVWVELTLSSFQYGTEAGLYYLGIVQDITDRKQYQAALDNLRRRYELILTSAGEGICELDRHGNIAFCNPTAARTLGYTTNRLIGTAANDLVASLETLERAGTSEILQEAEITVVETENAPTLANDLTCEMPQTLEAIGQVLQPENPTRQAIFRRRDGSTFPVDYVCTPILYDNESLGAVLTFKDITERQAVERMKNEFISIVSHELRTPLTSMRVALGVLTTGKLGQLPKKATNLVEIALHNSERLERLIDDLLDFQQLESGRITLDRAPHPVEELLVQSTNIMQAMADRDGIALVLDPLSESLKQARLWVDADRTLQVLTNLLSNAIKFSASGNTVTLRALWVSEDREESPRKICIQVCDRGRGIPSDRLESIFDPFQQVDASDSRQKGGTGLGLTICRRLVLAHGGRIWAENRSGGGTRMSVVLPLWEEERGR